MLSSRVQLVASAGLAILLGSVPACSSEQEAVDRASQVTVTAVDYAFRGLPDHLPAGPTVFTVRNEGGEGHDFILSRVAPGSPPVQEAIELPQVERERFLPRVARSVVVMPGETATVSSTLRPGAYAYLCLTTTESGRTHAYQGMWGTFSV